MDEVIKSHEENSDPAQSADQPDHETTAQPEQAPIPTPEADQPTERTDAKRPGLAADLLNGAIGGFVATAPMTLVMLLVWRKLPFWQKYPPPPYQITSDFLARVGLKQHTSVKDRVMLTLLSHFLYGALAGAFYGPLARRLPLTGLIAGPAYGFLIWLGSYLGWLPAFDIGEPATRQPNGRMLMMILAHFVWGSVTALVAEQAAKYTRR